MGLIFIEVASFLRRLERFAERFTYNLELSDENIEKKIMGTNNENKVLSYLSTAIEIIFVKIFLVYNKIYTFLYIILPHVDLQNVYISISSLVAKADARSRIRSHDGSGRICACSGWLQLNML